MNPVMRLREARRLGFNILLMTESSRRQLEAGTIAGIPRHPVRSVHEAVERLFG